MDTCEVLIRNANVFDVGKGLDIAVRDGKIAVTDASCASRDCVRHAPADHGAPIVCLPNHLAIKFTNSSDYDALIG